MGIDEEKLCKLQDRVEQNSKLLDEIVTNLVDKYSKPLDDYIKFIKSVLDDEEHPPTNVELDDFVMQLPALLYFTGEGVERLGIREDTSKAIKLEKYNEIYIQVKGTVGVKTATACDETQLETLANTAYSRAYKKIKLKLDLGNELLQSIKKVITRRTVEMELGRVDEGKVRGV